MRLYEFAFVSKCAERVSCAGGQDSDPTGRILASRGKDYVLAENEEIAMAAWKTTTNGVLSLRKSATGDKNAGYDWEFLGVTDVSPWPIRENSYSQYSPIIVRF